MVFLYSNVIIRMFVVLFYRILHNMQTDGPRMSLLFRLGYGTSFPCPKAKSKNPLVFRRSWIIWRKKFKVILKY